MIEGSWDRRAHKIRPYILMGVSTTPIVGQDTKSPISIYTTLSEMRFASYGPEDSYSISDPYSKPSPLSPISQLKFARPGETTAINTPIEPPELPPQDSRPPFPVPDLFSPERVRITPSTKSPPTLTHTIPASLPQPGWTIPKSGGPAVSGLPRVGRRPLPEIPERPLSRPLPPRPQNAIPCSDRFTYPPRQGFIQGFSGDVPAASRSVSDSGADTWNQPVLERRPQPDATSKDIPPIPRLPAPVIVSPLAISPSPSSQHLSTTVAAPVLFSRISKPDCSVPTLRDLLSPTSIDLVTAARLTVTTENGEQSCQDYIHSILNSVTREILEEIGADLVFIGNGAPGMIRPYKKTLRIPFAVYTDSSLQLHDALGLFKTCNVPNETSGNQASGKGYVKQNGRWASLRVAVRLAAAKMGGGLESGDVERLGGEFVFGPGLRSSFVHKMQNARDHTPIVEVLEVAGVDIRKRVMVRAFGVRTPTIPSPGEVDIDLTISAGSTTEPSPGTSSATAIPTQKIADEIPTNARVMDVLLTTPRPLKSGPPTPVIGDPAEWMVHRSESLMRIKQKKETRRRGVFM